VFLEFLRFILLIYTYLCAQRVVYNVMSQSYAIVTAGTAVVVAD